MNRTRTRHRCQSCGATAARWSGRCGTCGGWNTLVEERVAERVGALCNPGSPPVPVCAVPEAGVAVRPTGLGEFDRVMGGGLVPGSVTLVGGEPGIGKSTLTLQLLAAVVAGGGRALLVCGEESVVQVRMRAGRLGAVVDGLWLQAETALAQVIVAVEDLRPDVVVVDSIQTMHDDAVDAAPGSVAQVRECAAALVGLAKRTGTAVVLVGHVTKDGAIAGPRVLEHLVDTVCWFEGDRHHALRLLRTVKHRFGSTADLGVFEMCDEGLVAIEDPSALFLGDHRCGVPGAAVVATMEGRRPLLVEVQALVASGETPVPRRSAQGVDHNRLSVLLAVLAERCGLPNLAT
ncbi:MAG: DNA repair protein RadA, partial [Acidimicrobiia bacterium]